MIYLSDEQRDIGRDNYYSAVTAHDQMTRRDFIVRSIAAGGISAAGMGAAYFGYQKPRRPVRVSVIGSGDEGNVLIGALNPDYIEVKSICDIRPSSIHRAFHGDWATKNTAYVRPGLMEVYGWGSEAEARRNVKVMSNWEDAVADPDIDGVIIALPLHLHALVSIAAMKNGKHVLCEKLMAHNVTQCKLMARAAEETRSFLSVGHQRHYSVLYDNAVNLIRWGLLGEIHHIRAQWHRNNRPGSDTWAPPIPGGESRITDGKHIDKILDQLNRFKSAYAKSTSSSQRTTYGKQIAQWEKWNEDQHVAASQYGYLDDDQIYGNGRNRSALEELVRWRLWDRTGGGLMAELGSHQLDASSIFISALSKEVGKHVHPLTVNAVGGRHLFPFDRDADDHVYCMFEFPGQGYDYDFDVGYRDVVNSVPDPANGIASYEQDDHKKIVVSYSSINGNGFGGYGEVVMGTKGTLVLDREKEVMLYPIAGTYAKAGVKAKGDSVVLDTSASGDAAPAKTAEGNGPVSRGYKEEIEHWAWCISENDFGNQTRCNGEVALGDAVIALTAKQAIKNSQNPSIGHGHVKFQPGWFKLESDEVPEANSKEEQSQLMSLEKKNLGLA